MKHAVTFISIGSVLALMQVVGCGGGSAKQANRDFFTSGSREADQRAEQRMAKNQQLAGTQGATTGPIADSAKANENHSLFDRLGGEKGLTSIVEDFTPRVLNDPRVNWQRKGMTKGGFSIHRGNSIYWDPSPLNVQQLNKHLVQFLTIATGGPAHYDGRDMKGAHAGKHISNAEFDASVGDLKASLDKLLVPVKEQKELLSIIESTRGQIVEER